MLTRADVSAALRLIRSGGEAEPRTERLAAAAIGLLVLAGAVATAAVLPSRAPAPDPTRPPATGSTAARP